MRRAVVGVMLVTASVWLMGANDPQREDRSGINVLLISLDTVRAGHLHCYGYERETSPYLDKLAETGVLFEEMTAASSWTVPSHMSVFTSLYPSAHGVEDVTKCLSDDVPTMAQILSEHGYTTAAFVTSASLNHAMGFNRGFEHYDDFSAETLCHIGGIGGGDVGELTVNNVPTNRIITNLASNWLKKKSKDKFFLFVHYWDCHNDYIPPTPYDRQYAQDCKSMENGRNIVLRRGELENNTSEEVRDRLVALYDGEIAHTDAHVGKLLALLDELELSDNTLVIVFSDHGEGFWENGRLLHGYGLGEELVHVPLIFRLPDVLPAASRVKGNVSHVDVLPTTLGLLGIPKPEAIHGVDLSDVCLGKEEPPNRPVFSELNYNENDLCMVRWGSYKLVEDRKKTTKQIFVICDGKEIVPAEAGILEEDLVDAKFSLSAALTTKPFSANEGEGAATPSDLDEKTRKRIESLGYISPEREKR